MKRRIMMMKKTTSADQLQSVFEEPILFDANIFMVGIESRVNDEFSKFNHIKEMLLIPILQSFKDILIDIKVFEELDEESRALIEKHKDKNVKIVDYTEFYGKDPAYTDIYNQIDTHELFRYKEKSGEHTGEISSLAYAAYKNINYFCSKDAAVDLAAKELDILENITIITMESIILCATIFHMKTGKYDEHKKSLKSMYKKFCSDVIKRKKLPSTFNEFINTCQIGKPTNDSDVN